MFFKIVEKLYFILLKNKILIVSELTILKTEKTEISHNILYSIIQLKPKFVHKFMDPLVMKIQI